MKKYSKELKEEVIKLCLKEGRSQKSLEEQYNLGRGTVKYWIKAYREECSEKPEKQSEIDMYAELLSLKKKNQELEKEVSFLKKATAFFVKET